LNHRSLNPESLESRLLFAEVAGSLLINVNATSLTLGTDANDIANTGTLGGVFEAPNPGATPVVGRPVATATGGTAGIRLDGNDYLRLLQTASGGANLTATPAMTASDPVSIEAWVWNPGILTEETVVAWGKRGGPDGSNMSFNYGSDGGFGAVGHWGAPDMGWGANAVPAARTWHLIAYTYDGTDERVYVDGVQTNTENRVAPAINVAIDTPINIGSQNEADLSATGGLRGSLTLGRLRVHDGVLTPAQILSNYTLEKPEFVEPVIPVVTPPPLVKLVDINPTTLADGTPADNIANAGTLGGVFKATGAPDTVPVIDQPAANALSGTVGIRMDGTDYLQLVDAGGATIPSPASITGVDPKVTIEAWAWNPIVATEETMLSWSHRGGPDGSNFSFNYGSSTAFGAMGHWGSPDLGWGTVPARSLWHHLVYTYDGLTQRAYVDGAQTSSELLGENGLNIYPDFPINLGTQTEANGTFSQRGALTLGRVRIYSGVMTPADIAADYNTEKPLYVEPVTPPPPPPQPLTKAPVHRYSFSNPSGTADAAVIKDLTGTADGAVKGTGATFNGTRLILPGGASATAPYVDLPNGLISGLSAANGATGTGQLSIEGWIRHTGNQNWSRFFDFGGSTAGELDGPGGTGNGTSYLMYSAQTGGDTQTHRFELLSGGGNPQNRTSDIGSAAFNTDLHFVATWNETTGELKMYENGLELASVTSTLNFASISDVNDWLGRSQYTGDNNLAGQLDEFRIYDYVLTPSQIQGNLAAGPNVVNTPSAPTVSTFTVNGGAAQRSHVTSLTVKFNQAGTTLAAGAVKLTQLTTDANGILTGASTDQSSLVVVGASTDGGQTFPITFNTGASVANSLPDGVYQVVIDHTKVSNATGPMAADYTSPKFHRLFGDSSGDGAVSAVPDYQQFRAAFGKATGDAGYNAIFDFNGDGAIGAAPDYASFRSRFGKSFTYTP